jgi:hypothetical protein
MEINISRFFNEAEASGCAADYSASAAELGQDAGRITWNNANRDSSTFNLLDDEEKREAWREDVKGFGAWEEDEIAAWSDKELNALFLQFVSGDIREFESLCGDDWQEYERLVEQGTCSGRMYRGDDGNVYFYVGN